MDFPAPVSPVRTLRPGLELELEPVDDGQMADATGSAACDPKCHLIRCLTAHRCACYASRNLRCPSGATITTTLAEGCLRTPGFYALALQAQGGGAGSWGRRQSNTDIIHLVTHGSPIAQIVLVILLLFSAVSWGIILYKFWQFSRASARPPRSSTSSARAASSRKCRRSARTLSDEPARRPLPVRLRGAQRAAARGGKPPSRPSQRRPPDVQL